MADLVVHPSVVVGPEDIITADLLNLLATPVVELAIAEPVNDQSYVRNGNFYSSFWVAPAGMSCPVGVETSNANYWAVKPQGAAVTAKRSSLVPDPNSLFSHEIDGAVNVTDVEFIQHINADLSATLRRICTYSGNIFNASGLTLSPKLRVYTANSFNNFNTLTLQTTVDLQTCNNAIWTFVSATFDLSALANVANGLSLALLIPSGALSASGKSVNFSRVKFQIGEVSTEFVDDTSLFVTAPSVDSTMLQDGCIARPSLFLPHVVPSGAYVAKSIADGDIADNTITARALASTAVTGSLGYTPVNKAGDTGIGILDVAVDTVVGATSPGTSGLIIDGTEANKANDGYFPAIGFRRGTTGQTRSVGLDINGKLKTVDGAGVIGWLLDSVHQVDTASIQDKAVTLAKLSDALVALLISPGVITMFAGPNPPTGWAVCDGTPVSRNAPYDKLFAAIGTYWGSGNNIDTFNLPDLRGRAPIGYVNLAASGITQRALGTRGGEESHKLLISEIATHNHNINDPQHYHPLHDPGHAHGFATYGQLNATSGAAFAVAGGPVNSTTYNAATNITMDYSQTGIGILNNGGDGTHNNMSPFAVCYFIIKL